MPSRFKLIERQKDTLKAVNLSFQKRFKGRTENEGKKQGWVQRNALAHNPFET